jgi:hypothetical protein
MLSEANKNLLHNLDDNVVAEDRLLGLGRLVRHHGAQAVDAHAPDGAVPRPAVAVAVVVDKTATNNAKHNRAEQNEHNPVADRHFRFPMRWRSSAFYSAIKRSPKFSCPGLRGARRAMRCVDLSLNFVVRGGLAWPHARMPSAKDMIGRLERNEAYVSWLQPRDGALEDMFPAIRINESYYTLSLRMMKAVWRHVRLKRGFVNVENVPHIGTLLRIPRILLLEKLRTQERFNVSSA